MKAPNINIYKLKNLHPYPLLIIIAVSILLNIIQLFMLKRIIKKETIKEKNIDNNSNLNNEKQLTLDQVNERIESFKKKKIVNKEVKESNNENE